jgi:hypothetical protein
VKKKKLAIIAHRSCFGLASTVHRASALILRT